MCIFHHVDIMHMLVYFYNFVSVLGVATDLQQERSLCPAAAGSPGVPGGRNAMDAGLRSWRGKDVDSLQLLELPGSG